jgi:predicted enzyme related to lactoylglutathione lyase
VERATSLSATVPAPPTASPVGTTATLRDPQGGVFSVFQPAEGAEEG